MPASDFLVGLAFFLPMLACAVAGAWLLLGRRFGALHGSPRLVAFGMLLVLGLLAVHLVPAILGVLGRETVLVAAAIWLGAAALTPRGGGSPPASPAPRERPSGADRTTWALSGGAALLLALLILAVARDQLFLAPPAVDTLNFHLPGVARWIQSGSIWQIDVLLPNVAPGHYPNSGDMLLLTAVLPWNSDFLAHFVPYVPYLLTGGATYALGRELGAGRPAALAGTCLLLAVPAVLLPALIFAYPDALALFGFATGALFLLRHDRTGATSELVLAGLALGVAFGTKWYSVPAVAILVGAWLVARILAGRAPRTLARQLIVVSSSVALAGGIWMLRNWIESGNPVFPLRVAPLGVEIFDAPRDIVRERAGGTLADYLGDAGVWGELILPQLREMLAFGAAVIVAGIVAGLGVVVARRRERPPGWAPAAVAAVVALLLLAVYAITPYSAGGAADGASGSPTFVGADARYAGPALVIGAALSSWVATRFKAGPAVLGALAVAAVADAALQVSDSGLSLASIDARDWAAALALACAAVVLAFVVGRARARLDAPGLRLAGGLAAAAAVLLVAAGGYEMQKRFSGVRYVGQDPTVDYVLHGGGAERRVGLAGIWDNGISPVLPAFGPRLGNEVGYVGRESGGFLYRYRERDEFVDALARGGYELLFVGHGDPRRASLPEERWAESAGFERVARSDRLTLLRRPS